jgi:hypothetical protein
MSDIPTHFTQGVHVREGAEITADVHTNVPGTGGPYATVSVRSKGNALTIYLDLPGLSRLRRVAEDAEMDLRVEVEATALEAAQ